MITIGVIERDTELHTVKLDSPVGRWRLVWCDEGLVSSSTERNDPGYKAAAQANPPAWLMEAWDTFWQGNEVSLHLCSFKRPSDFSMSVYRAVTAIPPGKTLSYKEIAALVKKPQAARAVGGVMRNNPWAPFVPCHRVIGSDGGMCGYGGPAGVDTKAAFLEYEKSL